MSDADLARQRICPFCGTGPWASLGKHVVKAHDMSARAFKEAVGLTWSTSLDAPDLIEDKRQRAIDRNLVAAMRAVPHATKTGVSPAGRVNRGRGSGPRPRKIPVDAGPVIQSRIDKGERLRDIGPTYRCTASALSLFMKAWRARDG